MRKQLPRYLSFLSLFSLIILLLTSKGSFHFSDWKWIIILFSWTLTLMTWSLLVGPKSRFKMGIQLLLILNGLSALSLLTTAFSFIVKLEVIAFTHLISMYLTAFYILQEGGAKNQNGTLILILFNLLLFGSTFFVDPGFWIKNAIIGSNTASLILLLGKGLVVQIRSKSV